MVELDVVDIYWSQRRSVSYNEKEECYELGFTSDLRVQDCGFYCIYGTHPVYGQDVLLYIGETKLREGRSFFVRLREHFRSRFWYHQNLSYSTGLPGKELSDEETVLVESILIAAHKPALNRLYIDSAKEGCEKYLVRNWDFPGSLQFECSGGYWRQ